LKENGGVDRTRHLHCFAASGFKIAVALIRIAGRESPDNPTGTRRLDDFPFQLIATALLSSSFNAGNSDRISLIEPTRAIVRRFVKKALTESLGLTYTRQPARRHEQRS
jgi:hypothetical protein